MMRKRHSRRSRYNKRSLQRSEFQKDSEQKWDISLEQQLHLLRRAKIEKARKKQDRQRLKLALNRLSLKIQANQRVADDRLNKKDTQRALRRYHQDTKLNIDQRKVCKDRSKRRQSLFATGKAGKGVRGPEEKKYTEKSKVRC